MKPTENQIAMNLLMDKINGQTDGLENLPIGHKLLKEYDRLSEALRREDRERRNPPKPKATLAQIDKIIALNKFSAKAIADEQFHVIEVHLPNAEYDTAKKAMSMYGNVEFYVTPEKATHTPNPQTEVVMAPAAKPAAKKTPTIVPPAPKRPKTPEVVATKKSGSAKPAPPVKNKSAEKDAVLTLLPNFKPAKSTDWDAIYETILTEHVDGVRAVKALYKIIETGDALTVLFTAKTKDRLYIMPDFSLAFESKDENCFDCSTPYKSLQAARNGAQKLIDLMTA